MVVFLKIMKSSTGTVFRCIMAPVKPCLRPIPTMKPYASDDLSLVSCSSKYGCGNYCGYRNSGFSCSAMCKQWKTLSTRILLAYLPNLVTDKIDSIIY